MKRQLNPADDTGQLGPARKRTFKPPLLGKGGEQDILQQAADMDKGPRLQALCAPKGTMVPATQAGLAFRNPGLNKCAPAAGMPLAAGRAEGAISKQQPFVSASLHANGRPRAAPGLPSATRPPAVPPGLSKPARSTGLRHPHATSKQPSVATPVPSLSSSAASSKGKPGNATGVPSRSTTHKAAAPLTALAKPPAATVVNGVQGAPESILMEQPSALTGPPADAHAAVVRAQGGSDDGRAAARSSPTTKPEPPADDLRPTGNGEQTSTTAATPGPQAPTRGPFGVNGSEAPPARSGSGSESGPPEQHGIIAAASHAPCSAGAGGAAVTPTPPSKADPESAAADAGTAPGPNPSNSEASAGDEALDDALPLEVPVTLAAVPDVSWPDPPIESGECQRQAREDVMGVDSARPASARSKPAGRPAGAATAAAALPEAGAMTIRRLAAVTLLPPIEPTDCMAIGPNFAHLLGGLQVGRLRMPLPSATADLPGLVNLGAQRALKGHLWPVPLAAGHETRVRVRTGSESLCSIARNAARSPGLGCLGLDSNGAQAASWPPIRAAGGLVRVMCAARQNVLHRFALASRYGVGRCDADSACRAGTDSSGHTGAVAVASCATTVTDTHRAAGTPAEGLSRGEMNNGGSDGGGTDAGDGGTAQEGHRLGCDLGLGSSLGDACAAGEHDGRLQWSGLSMQFLADIFS